MAVKKITLSVLIINIKHIFLQAIIRNINHHGLKEAYQRVVVDRNGIRTYSAVKLWTKRLMGLAFIPPDDVPAAFTDILGQIPVDLPPEFDPFLAYFQTTWISGSSLRRNSCARYPPHTWNVRGRTLSLLNRTNNAVESFHSSFKQFVGHSNPTIWGFVSAMTLQQSVTDGIMTSVLVGVRPPKRKNKYIAKDNRILTASQQYGAILLLEFLDLMMDL